MKWHRNKYITAQNKLSNLKEKRIKMSERIERGSQTMLGERIRKLRIKQGMSLAELAQKTGIPASNLSNLETGEKNNPTLQTLLRIAEALQTSVDYLAGLSHQDTGSEVFNLTEAEIMAIIQWRRGQLTDAINTIIQTEQVKK
jgi:transcriptional regulator with XRE-family HTH domain